ncbi:MAG: hypothetical protein M0Q47_08635 [Methanothrix sp.]|nr:hypothetical protein [Methanothrix sp.]MCK9406457.1 hypothetical protein [Methanothrix sp.]
MAGLAGGSLVIDYDYLLRIWMQFKHKRDCTWYIESLHHAREVPPSRQHLVFEEVHSAKDYRSAGKQLVSVVEQELECIIVRTDDDVKMAIFILIFVKIIQFIQSDFSRLLPLGIHILKREFCPRIVNR